MQRFEYTDMNNRTAVCGITIGSFDELPVCVFSELNTNPGASITNTGISLLQQAKDKLKLPENTRYFEHYQWPDEMPNIDEILVTKGVNDDINLVEWQRMDPAFTANLVRYITFQDAEQYD